MILAIIHGHLETVKHLVTVCKISANKLSCLAGVVLLQKELANCHVSPFILACIQCCGDVIKYLVSEGHCDPREECNWMFGGQKIFPVVAAALNANTELIKYIVEVCDTDFDPFLHLSMEEWVIRDPEVIKFLMRHANMQDHRWSDVRELVMMSSVCSGLTDSVQYLVDNNIVDLYDVRYSYDPPYTYVDKAASNGHYDVMKYLVEKHASSYDCQVSESTVCAAASSGHLPLIEYLTKNYKGMLQ